MTPVAFAELAQSCAPMVAVETLAAVVSIESGFSPFAIRINTDHRPPAAVSSKREAIQSATALVAAGADIDLGLGGINVSTLQRLGVSIADAFDSCTNLKITGTLLDRYYRAAVRSGASTAVAERTMLNAYYGNGETEGGESSGFDRQVLSERDKLAPDIARLTIGPVIATGAFARPGPASAKAVRDADIVGGGKTARTRPGWDVFGAHRNSSTLVFEYRIQQE